VFGTDAFLDTIPGKMFPPCSVNQVALTDKNILHSLSVAAKSSTLLQFTSIQLGQLAIVVELSEIFQCPEI
jgi:hypothetical protein